MSKKLKLCVSIFVLMSAGIFSSSCNVMSTDSVAFSQKAGSSVKKGMTKAQVRNILGNPARVTMMNSQEIWNYTKTDVLRELAPLGLAGQQRSSVIVTFSTQGRVTNVNTVGTSLPPGSLFLR